MPGVLPETTWMSEEIVSGVAAVGDRHFGHGVVEAAAAVTDIEDDAALLGRGRRGQQPAVLHDVGEGAGDIRQAGIGVGQDIPRAQQVEDFRHQRDRRDAADVAHHPGAAARLGGRLDRPLERLGAVVGDDVLRHPHLDADRDVGVLCDRLSAGVDHGEVDVVELRHRKGCEPEIGDMHESSSAGMPIAEP
jgi:hypothetical protein